MDPVPPVEGHAQPPSDPSGQTDQGGRDTTSQPRSVPKAPFALISLPVQKAVARLAEGSWDEPAKWLMTAFVVLTTGLAALGISNAALQRALTNSRSLFLAAFVMILAALCLGLVGVAIKGGATKGLICITGIVAFYLGGVLLFAAVSDSEYTQERPSMTTQLVIDPDSGSTALDVTITSAGLLAVEDIAFYVYGVESNDQDSNSYIPNLEMVYEERTGPDRLGKIDKHIVVPIPAGQFSSLQVLAIRGRREEDNGDGDITCADWGIDTRVMSCSVITLPPATDSPTVDITYGQSANGLEMSISFGRGDMYGAQILVAEVAEMDGAILARSWKNAVMGRASGVLLVPLGTTRGPLCVRVWTIDTTDEAETAGPPCDPPNAAAFATTLDLGRFE